MGIQFALARIDMLDGDFAAAREGFAAIAEGLDAALGSGDPDAIRARQHIAAVDELAIVRSFSKSETVDKKMAALDGVEAQYHALLDRSRDMFSPDHPTVLSLLMSLGGLYWETSEYGESAEFYEEILRIEGDPGTWRTMSAHWALALIAGKTGDDQTAEEHLKRALAFGEMNLSPIHERTKRVRHRLARFYHHGNRPKSVEQLYLPDIAFTLRPYSVDSNNLAVHFFRNDELDDAMKWAEIAVLVRRVNSDGPPHELPISLNVLAKTHLAKRQTADALKCIREAVRLWNERKPKLDGHHASILTTLGSCLTATAEFDDAMESLHRAHMLAERSGSMKVIKAALEALIELSIVTGNPADQAKWQAELGALE